MSINHKTMTGEAFETAKQLFGAAATQLWSQATILLLDAILNYHQNSYSTSRIQQVYELFQASGMGTMTAATSKVLSQCTGTSNPKFVHNAKLLDGRERQYEVVLEELEANGLIFYKPAKVAKATAIKKAKTIKVPEGASDELVNALQKQIDAVAMVGQHDEAAAIRMISGSGGPVDLPEIKSGGLRQKATAIWTKLADLEGKTEAVNGPNGPEIGIDKANREADGTLNRLNKVLTEDYQALIAANDESAVAA